MSYQSHNPTGPAELYDSSRPPHSAASAGEGPVETPQSQWQFGTTAEQPSRKQFEMTAETTISTNTPVISLGRRTEHYVSSSPEIRRLMTGRGGDSLFCTGPKHIHSEGRYCQSHAIEPKQDGNLKTLQPDPQHRNNHFLCTGQVTKLRRS